MKQLHYVKYQDTSIEVGTYQELALMLRADNQAALTINPLFCTDCATQLCEDNFVESELICIDCNHKKEYEEIKDAEQIQLTEKILTL